MNERSRDPVRHSEPQRPWWRNVATLVAALALLATLVFNTLGVWQGTREQRETRENEQVQLLTQLNAFATETERSINATDAPDNRCKPFRVDTLPDAQEAKLFAALDYYEYLAWLFNRGRLTIRTAREYWAPNMIDAYRLGQVYFPQVAIEERYPELKRFRHQTDRALFPTDPCG